MISIHRPDLLSRQRIAIAFVVWIILLIGIGQHAVFLVADRLLVSLEVRHEAQIRLVLLVVVT